MAVAVKADWYLTRGSGATVLVLLTLTLVVGIVETGRASGRGWPRFLVDGVHRFGALLAVAFLVVHVLTAVLDSYVSISLLDAVIPFAGSYRPLWLGLGAVALDLLLAVVVTSLARQRLGHRAWRAVHWLAYAVWPVALVHALGTGSDIHEGWMALLGLACVAAALAAATARLLRAGIAPRQRLWGVTGLVTCLAAVSVWAAQGPLAAHWSRRAGTPVHHAVRGGS